MESYEFIKLEKNLELGKGKIPIHTVFDESVYFKEVQKLQLLYNDTENA